MKLPFLRVELFYRLRLEECCGNNPIYDCATLMRDAAESADYRWLLMIGREATGFHDNNFTLWRFSGADICLGARLCSAHRRDSAHRYKL